MQTNALIKKSMNYLIPEELETDRLILRMFRLEDWIDIHEYYSDPECTKYTSRRPLKENESWQKMAALIGHWQLRGYGSYAMEDKEMKRVIGVVGLDYPNDWPGPEPNFYWFNTGSSSFPFSVSEYSTVGETVANALRLIILLDSSIFNSFTNIRALIPSIDLSDNSCNLLSKLFGHVAKLILSL
jgi:Acetyltransferase (GNAT) domain